MVVQRPFLPMSVSRWFEQAQQPITFTCKKELFGVIPAPVKANSFLPEWFKKLPLADPEFRSLENSAITIKQCPPFLDALTLGYILLWPCQLSFEVFDDGAKVSWHSDFPHQVVATHQFYQIRGAPESTRAALKLMSFWTIHTPPVWSTLFTPLLNRAHPFFDVFSGVVDSDRYRLPVNIPFFMNTGNGLHQIDKATPVCQLIPFRRADLMSTSRAESDAESLAGGKQSFNIHSMTGWYRKFLRGTH
jgi:hypothetical protein